MKTLHQMLRELSRADVAEFAVVSDRLPCVKVAGSYEPIDDTVRSTAAILEMLVSVGGSRYVDGLEVRPAQWTARVDGVGSVGVAAVMRGGRVQVRFTLVGGVARAPSKPPRSPSRPPRGPSRPPRGPSRPPRTPSRPPRSPSHPALKPSEPTLRGAIVQPPVAAPAGGATLLESLVAEAREAGASDLHILPGRPLLLRIRGELVPRGAPLDEAAVGALVASIVPERARTALSEEGSCDFAFELGPSRFRANVSRQRTGPKACLRRIPSEVPTLAGLGLPAEIARATHHHQGLVLVTGPTGHGKTSTLAALVDVINGETTHHVITVEDPVEYVHPPKKAMISQREVGTHTRSFQTALKAALREDPDVIVVGELRDTETVRMALAASETGHLVLGTMNTPSAAKTIDRLIDLFPPADQAQVRMTLAGGLHLVVSQRLVAAGHAEGVDRPRNLAAAADGLSMAAAVELLPGSVALWSLIRDNKTYQIPSLQQRGKGFGIVRLDDSLQDLVRAGRVARTAALAVAENPEELDAVLSGKRPAAPAPAAPPFGKRS